MDSFRDRVAIVTGGASGIGRALCQELGRRDAVIVVSDINTEGAEQVAATISAAGGRARAARLDVRQADDVQDLITETVSTHGRLDYMFNNAGIAILGEVRDMNAEHWRRIIDINLMGVLYGTLGAYSLMVRQGFGHIVNTASVAGLFPNVGTTPYALTKHGVVGLSASLRAEGAAMGVKVSVVCPGPVQTSIIDSGIVVNMREKDPFSRLPQFVIMDPGKAARAVLRGVSQNRAIIVIPFLSRFFWWLHRISPSISDRLARHGINYFRQFRGETGSGT